MADAALKNNAALEDKVSKLLYDVEHLNDVERKVSINNLTALNEIRDTPFGQMIINTLSTYGTALLTTEGKTKSQKEKEAARKEAFDRCILFLQLEDLRQQMEELAKQIEQQWDKVKKSWEDYKTQSTTIDQSINRLNEKVNNVLNDPNAQEFAQKNLSETEQREYKKAVGKLENKWEALGHESDAIDAIKQYIDDRIKANAKPEEIKGLTTQLNIHLDSQMTAFFGFQDSLTNLYQFNNKKNFPREVLKPMEEIKELCDSLREEFKELKEKGLDLNTQSEELQNMQEKMQALADQIQGLSTQSGFSNKEVKTLQEISKSYQETVQSISGTLSTQAKLEKQLEEQKVQLSEIQANKAIITYTNELMEQSDGLTRQEFLDDRFDDKKLKELGFASRDEYCMADPENRHITTSNGDVVFTDEQGYYYYPGNDPQQQPQRITDEMEKVFIRRDAYEGDTPKFFGNETGYADRFDKSILDTGQRWLKNIFSDDTHSSTSARKDNDCATKDFCEIESKVIENIKQTELLLEKGLPRFTSKSQNTKKGRPSTSISVAHLYDKENNQDIKPGLRATFSQKASTGASQASQHPLFDPPRNNPVVTK